MLRLPFCTLLLCLGCFLPRCHGQPDPAAVVGGPFENRELFYAGMPDRIDASDTTAGWYTGGPAVRTRADRQIADHDIIVGRNIPHHPAKE